MITSRRLLASLFFVGTAWTLPLSHIARTQQGLVMLRMLAGAKNIGLEGNPNKIPRRQFAQVVLVAQSAVQATQAALATGVCIGATCWSFESFYNYYGLGGLSKSTKKAIQQAFALDEANAIKALTLIKDSKISFESAYTKVYDLNRQAHEIALQTGEDPESVYKRLVYEQASSEFKQQLDQEDAKKQALVREIKNNFSNVTLPEPKDHIDYVKAIKIVEETQQAAPTSKAQDGLTIPEKPESASVCEITSIEPEGSLILQNSGKNNPQNSGGSSKNGGPSGPNKPGQPKGPNSQKEPEKPRKNNSPQDLASVMKEIKKDYEYDKQKRVWRLKDNGNELLKDAMYLKEDRLHNEIELYDKRCRHLGALDPLTKKIIENSQDINRK